jgi:hypothetical protein
MTNPLLQLKALGQSVWLDDIDRGQLRSGLFQRLIDEDGLSGATGNPTIFEHSITHSTTYDEQMQQLLALGKSAQEIYEALAMTDVKTVADLLPSSSNSKRCLAKQPTPMPAWPIRSSNGCSADRALRRSSSEGHVSNGLCGPARARRIRPTGMYCTSRN